MSIHSQHTQTPTFPSCILLNASENVMFTLKKTGTWPILIKVKALKICSIKHLEQCIWVFPHVFNFYNCCHSHINYKNSYSTIRKHSCSLKRHPLIHSAIMAACLQKEKKNQLKCTHIMKFINTAKQKKIIAIEWMPMEFAKAL